MVPGTPDDESLAPGGASAAATDPEADGPDEATAEHREDIMRATYHALCSCGYADLTMQSIADEAPVSKAALHYHYDSKRALLTAFQEYISERFLARVHAADDPTATPPERLASVLDAALSPPEDDGLRDLQTALLELKAQAPYDADVREQVAHTDDAFRGVIEEILAAGVESGDFDATLDPAETATFVATVMVGNQARQVSVGQSPADTRELLRTHVERPIVAAAGGTRPDPEGSE